MYAARSGYEIVGEIGVSAIREKSVRQTQRLIELALEAGFRVHSCRNPAQRGGTVVIDVPDGVSCDAGIGAARDAGGLPAAGGHPGGATLLHDR